MSEPFHSYPIVLSGAELQVLPTLVEGDCACPDDGLALTQVTLPEERASYRLPALYTARLSQDFSLAFNPLAQAGVVVFNLPVLELLNAFQEPRRLDDGVRVAGNPPKGLSTVQRLVRLGLLEPVNSLCRSQRILSQTLTAWLHVTNACNLRCTYCYVSKSDEAMDKATGLAAIDAVIRSATRHGFKTVKLKYAGGEATLNFRLIRLLHEYAQDQASSRGLTMQEVILSNGIGLSDAMLYFIRNAGMRLMISMDGPNADQDVQRVFSNGGGSSLQVARSVDRAIACGAKPHLSITVTRHNADLISAAVAFALERELLFNLNFYRDNGYVAKHEELAAEDAQLIAGAKAAFQIIEEQMPRQNLIAALVDRSSFITPHDRPCGAGLNYLVIDHNGGVARCQMEIERTLTDVIALDPLEVIRLQSSGFSNPSVDEKEGCGECQWRYWCAGGCPMLSHRVAGRSNIRSPYCAVYQALFPDLLRLEGLRLLKWGVL